MEHNCDTCEHENDSGIEYCGCCNELTDNWKEAGWHIEKRLSNEMKQLKQFILDWDGHDKYCGVNSEGFEGCDETLFNCDCGYSEARNKILSTLNES